MTISKSISIHIIKLTLFQHKNILQYTLYLYVHSLVGRRFRQRIEQQFQLQARGYAYREGRLVISLISNALASVILHPRRS